jgi:hypothetical protein
MTHYESKTPLPIDLFSDHDDDLRTAKGFILGVSVGIALWVFGFVVWDLVAKFVEAFQ